MKKVVDTGALRSEKLRKYLSAYDNHAVITDFTTMEILKGDSITNIKKSLDIVSGYPKKVVILKSTSEIMELRPRSKGLQSRFVDEKQTRGFPDFCEMLYDRNYATRNFNNNLLEKGRYADGFLKMYPVLGERFSTEIQDSVRTIGCDEISALRKKRKVPENIGKYLSAKIVKTVEKYYSEMSVEHKGYTVDEIYYSFPFRLSCAIAACTTRWMADGGYENVKNVKIGNDIIDSIIISFATFFDGVVTNDNKLEDNYFLTKAILAHFKNFLPNKSWEATRSLERGS